MSRNLANRSIGALRSGRRRTAQPEVPTVSVAAQVETQNVLLSMPEYQVLLNVPGIQPYLVPALLPDLLYFLTYDGAEALINAYYLSRAQELRLAFRNGGLDGFFATINPEMTSEQRSTLTTELYAQGAQVLAQVINRADPSRPESIIFQHPSQEVHRQTQKVEIDLIKDEPELVERTDIQCRNTRCGARRIQTAIVQTRSADEPATVFARCVACKSQWQFSLA